MEARTRPDAEQTTGDPGASGSDGGAVEQVQNKAKEVGSQVQDTAREAAGQAGGRMRAQVDQRSTWVGEQLRSGARDARSVADELREQGKDTPARYVEQAAERAERLGGYFRDSDGDRILGDVEGFARRNTWAVAVGGLALGLAASRLLKASSTERYRSLERSRMGDMAPSVSPAADSTGERFKRESDPAGAATASTGFAAEPSTRSSRSESTT